MLRTISVVGDPACVRQWLLDEEADSTITNNAQ
jgi:hypothetical protein